VVFHDTPQQKIGSFFFGDNYLDHYWFIYLLEAGLRCSTFLPSLRLSLDVSASRFPLFVSSDPLSLDTGHDVLSSRGLFSPRHWRIQALGAPNVHETTLSHIAPTPSFRFDPQVHLYPQETLQTPRLSGRSHPDRFRSQSLAGRVLEDRLKRSFRNEERKKVPSHARHDE